MMFKQADKTISGRSRIEHRLPAFLLTGLSVHRVQLPAQGLFLQSARRGWTIEGSREILL
jgi:hypothetical protein